MVSFARLANVIKATICIASRAIIEGVANSLRFSALALLDLVVLATLDALLALAFRFSFRYFPILDSWKGVTDVVSQIRMIPHYLLDRFAVQCKPARSGEM